MITIENILAQYTREGDLWEKLDERRIRCHACAHECPILEGQCGVCKVRRNQNGRLLVPWGYVSGAHCDPIEKKPFYHVRPGALAFSFGMLGCDLHCGYCQNWITSQALRDPEAVASAIRATPEGLARQAVACGAGFVVSTYNEPLITVEWAVAVFRAARAAGLATGFVSNGNATREVLEYLRPHLDLYKVDLKSFSDANYRNLGGRLAPVLDSIRRIHQMGFWMEVVTLVVPGFNDSDAELRQIAEFLRDVSPDIPWHATAYHGDYKMTAPEETPVAALKRAVEIGRAAGLHYVYAGNMPGSVGEFENTFCPDCHKRLVRRWGYRIMENLVTAEGRCPVCDRAIAGRWQAPAAPQATG